MIRIPVDFNTMAWDDDERVWINTNVHKDVHGLLRPGMTVLLCDTDLEVEAIVESDGEQASRQLWGRPNWSTKRDLPCPASCLRTERNLHGCRN